ncbi:MAG: BspA family leucine-rich repeat surface protein [Tidjanibacter sp.]|nr:BspA family leucine-rich repeat surface protein [Tidjanibacter sp.]
MKALTAAIYALDNNSSIVLDMSAVKAVATTVESQELLYNAFRDTGSLESPALKEFVFPTDQSNITSLKYTFYKCPNLTSVSPLPSGVKTLSNTFNSCLSFNQPIEIPSSVTDMAGTFQSCSSFNQPIEIPSGVTTITYMLYSCRLFNQSITIPASVTNISMAFKVTAISGKTITIKSTKFDVGGVQGTNTFETYNTPTIDLVLSPALYGAISAENLAAKIWEKATWKSITQAQ